MDQTTSVMVWIVVVVVIVMVLYALFKPAFRTVGKKITDIITDQVNFAGQEAKTGRDSKG